MAYQIKKSNKIVEDLELLGDNNEVELTIHVDINVEKMAGEIRKTQINMLNAQKLAESGDDEAVEKYGEAVIEAVELLIGKEQTVELLNYFDGKYSDMAIKIMPFAYDVIYPALEKEIKAKKEIIANNCNLNKAQKRRLGL